MMREKMTALRVVLPGIDEATQHREAGAPNIHQAERMHHRSGLPAFGVNADTLNCCRQPVPQVAVAGYSTIASASGCQPLWNAGKDKLTGHG